MKMTNELRVGMVGILGGAGYKMHRPSIEAAKNAELVAGYDLGNNPDLEASLRAEGVKVFHNLEEFLQQDLDVVDICSSSGSHEELAIAAAHAGKNVMIEKPISISLEGLDNLIRARNETGVIMSGWFQNTSGPDMRVLYDAIANGELGDIVAIESATPWYRTFGKTTPDGQPGYFFGADGQRNWKATWEEDGGGSLMNQSIHYVHLPTWFLKAAGQKIAAIIEGVAANILHFYNEAEDMAYGKLIIAGKDGTEIPEGGFIEGTTTWYCGEGRERPQRLTIYGTKGYARIQDGKVVQAVLNGDYSTNKFGKVQMETGGGGSDPTMISAEVRNAHMEEQMGAFAEGKALIPLEEAAEPVRIIEAVYESGAKNGERIDLPQEAPYFKTDKSLVIVPPGLAELRRKITETKL